MFSQKIKFYFFKVVIIIFFERWSTLELKKSTNFKFNLIFLIDYKTIDNFLQNIVLFDKKKDVKSASTY